MSYPVSLAELMIGCSGAPVISTRYSSQSGVELRVTCACLPLHERRPRTRTQKARRQSGLNRFKHLLTEKGNVAIASELAPS